MNAEENALLELSSKELVAIMKKLKIKGWSGASKPSMARQIVFRTEQRKKFAEHCRVFGRKGAA